MAKKATARRSQKRTSAVLTSLLPMMGLLVARAEAQSQGEQNTTINYNDPRVVYQHASDWQSQASIQLTYSNVPWANFTIPFSGHTVYLASSKKFDRHFLSMTVDGQDAGAAPLYQAQSLGTSASSTIVWSHTGMSDGNHTLVAYNNGDYANSTNPWVSFSALIVTSGGSSNSDSSSSSNSSKGAIIGGAVGGAIGLLLILALIFILFFRRRRRTVSRYDGPQEATAHEVLDVNTVHGSGGARSFGSMGQVTPFVAGASRPEEQNGLLDSPRSTNGFGSPSPRRASFMPSSEGHLYPSLGSSSHAHDRRLSEQPSSSFHDPFASEPRWSGSVGNRPLSDQSGLSPSAAGEHQAQHQSMMGGLATGEGGVGEGSSSGATYSQAHHVQEGGQELGQGGSKLDRWNNPAGSGHEHEEAPPPQYER